MSGNDGESKFYVSCPLCGQRVRYFRLARPRHGVKAYLRVRRDGRQKWTLYGDNGWDDPAALARTGVELARRALAHQERLLVLAEGRVVGVPRPGELAGGDDGDGEAEATWEPVEEGGRVGEPTHTLGINWQDPIEVTRELLRRAGYVDDEDR